MLFPDEQAPLLLLGHKRGLRVFQLRTSDASSHHVDTRRWHKSLRVIFFQVQTYEEVRLYLGRKWGQLTRFSDTAAFIRGIKGGRHPSLGLCDEAQSLEVCTTQSSKSLHWRDHEVRACWIIAAEGPGMALSTLWP